MKKNVFFAPKINLPFSNQIIPALAKHCHSPDIPLKIPFYTLHGKYHRRKYFHLPAFSGVNKS